MTLTIDSFPTYPLRKHHDVDMEAGDIEANQTLAVIWNATDSVYELFTNSAVVPLDILHTQTAAGVKTFTDGIVSDLTGNVTGDVSGNLTGDVTGNADTATLATTATKHGSLNVKVIDIGDWDMDAAPTAQVAHGLTHSKIRNISVLIRRDDDLFYYDFDAQNYTETSSSDINVGSTDVNLIRATTGFFDSGLFNSTSYNRGWITIQYID